MKSFILTIINFLLLTMLMACSGQGTNTGNPTEGPSNLDNQSVCEISGGVLVNDDTECECPDDSVIDPDEECTQNDVSGSSVCEQSGGVMMSETICLCPTGEHVESDQQCRNMEIFVALKKQCENTGGNWQLVSGCGDACYAKRADNICDTSLNTSCFCGEDRCWNGTACEDL